MTTTPLPHPGQARYAGLTPPAVAGAARLSRVRWAVRAVLALGVAASIAANVLHARPNLISQLIAAWPPLALLLTVELISRVPADRRGLAVVRLLAAALIAGIAAWVSYWHMAGVAARYGETGAAASYLLPISVDGLVMVASISLVEIAGRIHTPGAQTVTAPADIPPAVGDQPVPHPSAPAPDAADGGHCAVAGSGPAHPAAAVDGSAAPPAGALTGGTCGDVPAPRPEGPPPSAYDTGGRPTRGFTNGVQTGVTVAGPAPRSPVVGDNPDPPGDDRTGSSDGANPAGSPGIAGTIEAADVDTARRRPAPCGGDGRPLVRGTPPDDRPRPAPPARGAETVGTTEIRVGGGIDDAEVPADTAAAVAHWYQRDPSLHPADIATRIGRSERTVRRYWPPSPPRPAVNGYDANGPAEKLRTP